MGYTIKLTDPVDNKIILLPFAHTMTGSTFPVELDIETGMFVKKPFQDARLDITYNYAKFYYEATLDDERFYDESGNRGIRGIYGKSGVDSIPMLEDIIARVRDKYPDLDCDDNYWVSCPGNAIKPLYQLIVMAKLRPDGVWEGD